MKTVHFLVCLLLLSVCHGQQRVVDSLKLQLEQVTDDSVRIHLLANISFKYVYIAPDSGLIYGKLAIELAEEVSDSIGLTVAHNSVGADYAFLGDFDSAKYHFEKVVELANAQGDDARAAKATNNLGLIAWKRGDYVEAIRKYQEALAVHEKNGYTQGMANNLNNIGIVFKEQQDHEQALMYYQQSLALKRQLGDTMGSARTLSNIANIYMDDHKPELALENHFASLRLREKMNDRSGLTASLHNIGLVYHDLGMLDSAESYHNQALAVAKDLNSKEDESAAIDGLADVYLEQGRNKQALDYAISAHRLAKETGFKFLEKNTLFGLYRSYAANGQYEQAYKYQQAYHQLKDSLFNADRVKEITQIESSYQFKKEKDSIQFARDREAILFQTEIETQELARSRLLIGMMLSGLLVIVVLVFYRNKVQTNKRLKTLNAEVSDQNERLENLNQTKTKLFSIVSHDLRGPMSVFQGAPLVMKKLLDKGKTDQVRSWLTDIEQYAGQLTTLLDNLLSWAINEKGEFPYHPESIYLRKSVQEVVDYLEGQAAHKEVTIAVGVLDHLSIWADKNSLSTILRNLIGNAIKFTPAQGKVAITAEEQNDMLMLKVADSGVGMTEDQVNKLFKESKRSSVGTDGEKGVGLGLQLVQDFVRMNRAKLEVVSEPGKGSTFTIHFPIGN